MKLLTPVLASAILATSVAAHPGHDMHAEMAERAAFTKYSKRDLSHCAAKLKARGLEQRAIARRAATAMQARQMRNIPAGSSFTSKQTLFNLTDNRRPLPPRPRGYNSPRNIPRVLREL
jgi:hypothetical protein